MKKIIIFTIVGLGIISISLFGYKSLDNSGKEKSAKDTMYGSESIETGNNENSSEIIDLSKISEDKKIYISSENMLMFEPTVENLYEYANIVLVGTFEGDLKTYVSGVNINTLSNFKISKCLKNTTTMNISSNISIRRDGGVMLLSDYVKNNTSLRDDEFKDISESERSSYYIIKESKPSITLTKSSKEYIVFLAYLDNEFVAYQDGIREINSNNEIYDYETDKFVKSTLLK